MIQNNAAYVEWDREDNQVYVTSKPEYIFTGNYYFDESEVWFHKLILNLFLSNHADYMLIIQYYIH